MCLFNSPPSVPEVKEVQKPQEVKQVEQSAYGSTVQNQQNQQNKNQMGGAVSSTLLTGANGLQPGALTLGKTTLLGQ